MKIIKKLRWYFKIYLPFRFSPDYKRVQALKAAYDLAGYYKKVQP
jgi:hypothetical protein